MPCTIMQCSIFLVRWLSLLLFTLRTWGNFNSTNIEFYYNFPAEADTLISLFIIPFTNYMALFITIFFHQGMKQLYVRTCHPKNIIFTKTEIESFKIMRSKYKEKNYSFVQSTNTYNLRNYSKVGNNNSLYPSQSDNLLLKQPERNVIPPLAPEVAVSPKVLTHFFSFSRKGINAHYWFCAQILLNYMYKTYMSKANSQSKIQISFN